MSQIKDYTQVTTPAASDVFAIQQGGTVYKMRRDQIGEGSIGSVTAGTSTTVFTAGLVPSGVAVGWHVVYKPGTTSAEMRRITALSTNQITVDSALAGTPAAGDGLFYTADPIRYVSYYAEDLQAAIDDVPSGGGTVQLSARTYEETATINFHNLSNICFQGVGGSGSTQASIIEWDGAAGGTVLSVDRVRDCTFRDFSIRPGSGTVTIAVDLDQTVAGSTVTTNNVFERISVYNCTYGFRISNTATTNVDLCTFRDISIGHDDPGTPEYVAGAYGFHLSSFNAKVHRIIGGQVTRCEYAIYIDKGQISAYGLNMGQSGTCIRTVSVSDPISFIQCHAEVVERLLETSFGTQPWMMTFIGGNYDTSSVHTDNNYVIYKYGGTLNIQGCDFQGDAGALFDINNSTNGCTLISIGNTYPSSSPWTLGNGAALVSLGDYGPAGTALDYVIGPQHTTNYVNTSITGIDGLSSSHTQANNISGSATLSSGAVTVTFATAEPNASYKVFVQGYNNETFYISNRLAASFDINSSNGSSTATVDWFIVRSG